MIDWWVWEVPADLAALALLTVAVVTGVWGSWSLLHVRRVTGRFRSPGRADPDAAFEWWLALFLVADSVFYAVLALLTAFRGEPVFVWGLVLVTPGAITAAGAMRWWAESRWKERR